MVRAARARIVCFAALLLIGAAGCGGSTSTTTATSSALTKSELIAKGDAICTTARQRLATLQAKVDKEVTADQASDTPANRAALAAALREAAQLAAPLLAKLRALTPPASDRAVISQYLSGVGSQLTLFNSLADAITRNDVAAVRTVSQQLQQGKTTIQGLAQSYGFKVCGSGP